MPCGLRLRALPMPPIGAGGGPGTGCDSGPTFWSEAAGKCDAVITGPGRDAAAGTGKWHYSLRIYYHRVQRFNYHVYFLDGSSGNLKWRVVIDKYNSVGRYTGVDKSYPAGKGGGPAEQAGQASQESGKLIQNDISKLCGNTGIAKLLRVPSSHFPQGVLPYVFFDVYDKTVAGG